MFTELLTMFSSVWDILGFFLSTFIYWAPFVFFPAAYYFYVDYKRSLYISNMDWTLIEIKLPKEIKKTPLAMEIVLSILHQPSPGTWFEQLTLGKLPAWFALEMVSLGGKVHFYIRTPKLFRPLIEAQIYAQYPSVEIIDAEDYALFVDYKTTKDSGWDMFGVEYALKKPDAYPIKTYVDFGLEREGVKDEERTDPLSTDLEVLGLVNKDEQLWIQFVVTATRDRFRGKKKHWWTKHVYHDWKVDGQDLIDSILERKKDTDITTVFKERTPVDDMAVKAIERNISKLGFDCGIRSIYLTKGEFRGTFAKALLGMFKQYSSNSLNAFKPGKVTGFDFPWDDFKDIRLNRRKSKMFNAYKRRGYFYAPFKGTKPMVLNTEELATLYHFPGNTSEAPMIGRIESRKGDPPANLPV